MMKASMLVGTVSELKQRRIRLVTEKNKLSQQGVISAVSCQVTLNFCGFLYFGFLWFFSTIRKKKVPHKRHKIILRKFPPQKIQQKYNKNRRCTKINYRQNLVLHGIISRNPSFVPSWPAFC